MMPLLILVSDTVRPEVLSSVMSGTVLPASSTMRVGLHNRL